MDVRHIESFCKSLWVDPEVEVDLLVDKGIVPNTRKDAHDLDQNLGKQDLRWQTDTVQAETAQGQETEREVEEKGKAKAYCNLSPITGIYISVFVYELYSSSHLCMLFFIKKKTYAYQI